MRALELTATQNDLPGYVVKARSVDGDQIAVKAEPGDSRAWVYTFDEFDLAASYHAILTDFSQSLLTDLMLEELMLEYLGNRRRSVRWQVRDWIAKR
jgi:hypothetical protein